MTVFIVTVSNYTSGRYIDSIWLEAANAAMRVEELTAELQRCGYKVGKTEVFHVWIAEGRAQDAKRADGEKVK